jgi:hypothetical protein
MTAAAAMSWKRASVVFLAVGAALLRDPRVATAHVSVIPQQDTFPHVERLTGTVYDSLVRAPLAGAFIQAVLLDRGTVALSAVSDSDGRFVIRSVPPGRYLVSFYHERLDSLGIRARVMQVTVAAAGDSAEVSSPLALATPSPSTILRELCFATDLEAPSDLAHGAFIGAAIDGTTALPVEGAHVTVSAWRRGLPNSASVSLASVTTGANGRFVICGLPTGIRLSVTASHEGARSRQLSVILEGRSLAHAELSLDTATTAVVGADSLRLGELEAAQYVVAAYTNLDIRGRVRDSAAAPVIASVRLVGSGAPVTTDQDGRFTVRASVPGAGSLQVRAIGYRPVEYPIVVDGDTAHRHPSLIVQLDRNPVVLDKVVVNGVLQSTGFLQRRRAGFGSYFDSDDIQRINPSHTSDIIHHVPSVRVRVAGATDNVVLVHDMSGRQCVPTLYLDGRAYFGGQLDITERDINMLVRPDEIAAVEVYNADQTPAQFRNNKKAEKCGVILVWRKQ